jgi:hypothetical protein
VRVRATTGWRGETRERRTRGEGKCEMSVSCQFLGECAWPEAETGKPLGIISRRRVIDYSFTTEDDNRIITILF